jgi:raffinose synthase
MVPLKHAPPVTPPSPGLHRVRLDGGRLATAGGAAILDAVRDQVWASEASDMLVLGARVDAPGSSVDIPLGRLRCRRWMCCARNKLWWMTPEWGTSAGELPPETQVSGRSCGREGAA